ncbi:helix-turn-helix domain-containing protein [Phycicoccus avicenniae]|uniref:helix-turn-helix domain-containing protein n=1 Tax=Phycicoccus avicenniae TaxID=2828860 RepID=UPI003D2DD98B
MTVGASFVSTQDAARALGVTVQHVRRLADSGDLVRVARGLIDRDSLESYIAERHGGRTRVWAEHTAWAAVAMLSGVSVDWLGPSQTSRLRGSLRAITDTADLVTRTRDRARNRTYRAHPSALRRLHDELVIVDTTGLGLVGATTDSVDGYLDVDRLDSTLGSFSLQPDPSGNVTLRATGLDLGVVRDLALQGVVLAALDAAASRDPRERGVGERALADALDRFQR